MRNALLIAQRELRSYLRSPLGGVAAAAMLLVDGLLFQAMAMDGRQALGRRFGRLFLRPERRHHDRRSAPCRCGSSPTSANGARWC